MTSLLRVRAIPWPGLPREWLALALACAIVSPPALHEALAAVAGTLFEAAPFVLAASLFPRARFGASVAGLIGLIGCGCRGYGIPGALALPAIALCTLSFGWPIALARTLGALALAAILELRRSRARGRSRELAEPGAAGAEGPQPFEALADLIPPTLAAVLLRDVVAQVATVIGTAPPAIAAEVAFGALLGWMMPCATAGIAVAAAFHGPAPAVTLGILVTCGIVGHARHPDTLPEPIDRVTQAPTDAPKGARLGFAIVGIALVVVACGGATGFVSPRLGLLLCIGSALAITCAVRPLSGVRLRWLVPLVLFGSIVAGSPPPTPSADATTLEDAFPGESLAFTGRAHRSNGHTFLERPTITCCRIDARSVAIELAATLPVAAGTWVAATGTLVRDVDGRLRLAMGTWRAIAPPHDPFAYR